MAIQLDQARAAGYSDSEILKGYAESKQFDLEGARKAGYSDKEILDRLAVPPAPAAKPERSFSDALLHAPGELLQGIGAGAISTGVGAYKLARKIPGADTVLPAPSPFVESLTQAPDSYAGTIGKGAEQMAEFAAPLGATAKLLKAAPLAARLAGAAGTAALTTGVQTGGDEHAMGVSGLTVGALEGAGSAVGAGYRALLKGGTKEALTADLLRTSAQKEYARVLNPTTKGNKIRTERVVPELIDRGVTAMTTKGLANRAAGEAEKAGQALGDAYENLPNTATIPLSSVTDGLEQHAAEHFTVPDAKGAAVPMSDLAQNGLDHIDGLKKALTRVSVPNPETGALELPVATARRLRQYYDQVAKDAGRYDGKALADQTAGAAHGMAADSLRSVLAQEYPDLASLNKEFSFWSDVSKVTNDTLLRRQGQSKGLGTQILGAVGAGAGAVTGGIHGAFVGKAAMSMLSDATSSPAWRTVASVLKDRLADAIAKGERGEATFLVNKIARQIKASPQSARQGELPLAPGAVPEPAPSDIQAFEGGGRVGVTDESAPPEGTLFAPQESQAAPRLNWNKAPDPAAAPPVEAPQAAQASPREPQPGDVLKMDPQEIIADPARFQFKRDTGGKSGTSDELKSIKKYDPELGGVLSVWRDPADGKTYVVNGHHRLELAMRSQAPEVTARYLHAETAIDARTKGALINIAGGRGSAIDAAKLLRDADISPSELEDRGISLKGAIARDGANLSNLSPQIFDHVVSGDLPVQKASLIGELLPHHADQQSAIDLLGRAEKNGKTVSNDVFREMVSLVKDGPKKMGAVDDNLGLFGDTEPKEESAALEMAGLSDYVRKRLMSEKKLFGTVADVGKSKVLEDAGNSLVSDKNAELATGAGQHLAVYDKLKASAGAINDTLRNAAGSLGVKGAPANDIKEHAYQRIRKAIAETLGGKKTEVSRNAQSGPGIASSGNAAEGQAWHQSIEPSTHELSPSQRGVERAFTRQLQADPEKAVAQYRELVAKSDTGNVISADDAKELSPDYRADRTHGAVAVHEGASAVSKEVFRRSLAEPAPAGKLNQVLFTAGASGAGKTTALQSIQSLKNTAENSHIVFDGTLAKYGSAVSKIDQVLASGKQVAVAFVDREPVDAFSDGVLPRAVKNGRFVNVATHVDGHTEIRDTIKKLKEKYAGNPNVTIDIIDNRNGRGKAKLVYELSELQPAVTDKPALTNALEDSLQKAFAAGTISKKIFDAATSRP